MPHFSGIDSDSNGVYVVFVDEEIGRWLGCLRADLNVRGGSETSIQRARRVRDLMPGRSSWDDVVAVTIEDTRSRERNSIAAQARVQGAILACLPATLELYALTPNERKPKGWKALTVGKTNASKAEIKAWAIEQGAPPGLRQDFYDAFGLARAGRTLWLGKQRTRGAA